MKKNRRYLLAGMLAAALTAADTSAAMAEAPVLGASTEGNAGNNEESAASVVEAGGGMAESVPVVEAGANAPAAEAAGGGLSEGGSPAAGGGPSEGGSPVVGGGSPVIGVGAAANSSSGGPGMAAGQGLSDPTNVVPGRIDYFAEPVKNPTVAVAEKYSYESMVSDLEKLKSRYGGKLQVNVIGTSWDGRNIYEAVLGNPDAGKHVLIHAGIHAREYMTPLLVMKQLEYGLEFYDRGSFGGQSLSALLGQVAVHFVPMVNPDGIAMSQFGLDAIRSEQLRQEIQQCYAWDVSLGRTAAPMDRYLSYWKANGRGVDLNQNFPADWDMLSADMAPSYAGYRGPEPLSEPESQALANLANSRKWAATVSYHSMGNVIYWDYQGNRVQQASGEMTALLEGSTGYRAAGSSGHGGFKDWTQIKEDPIPGVTIETGSVACPLPLSEYGDIWNRNKMVWAVVARYAMEH